MILNYSFIKSLLASQWHIDWLTFQQYYPLYRGVLNGLTFGEGKEEANSLPYNIAVSAGSIKAGNTPNTEEKYVQIIPIRGLMLKHDMECGPAGMRTIGTRLTRGEKATNIIGSILLFESGGGQSDAVPEIAEAIQACKKPVLAFVDGHACSAAMYAASYCSEIIASRATDIVGSIGTMIASEGFEAFSKDANGVVHFRIYADSSPDKNEEFETAIKGDFKLVKESILNPANEQFKADMRANRSKVTEAHLTGKTFKASEVLGVLVDSIGTLVTAVNRVVELAEADKKSNQSTQLNLLNMAKFPLLLATLGITELAVQEGQSSLNPEQLELIENALETAATARTELNTANANLATANSNLQTANERITALEKELEKKPAEEPLSALALDAVADENTEDKTLFGTLSNLQKEFNVETKL